MNLFSTSQKMPHVTNNREFKVAYKFLGLKDGPVCEITCCGTENVG